MNHTRFQVIIWREAPKKTFYTTARFQVIIWREALNQEFRPILMQFKDYPIFNHKKSGQQELFSSSGTVWQNL